MFYSPTNTWLFTHKILLIFSALLRGFATDWSVTMFIMHILIVSIAKPTFEHFVIAYYIQYSIIVCLPEFSLPSLVQIRCILVYNV